MDPRNYTIKPEPNLVGLASESVALTKQTSSPDPSFNQYAESVGRMNGYAKANRWLALIMPNGRVSNYTQMRRHVDIPRLATTCKSITMTDQSWYTTEQADINAGASRIFPYKRNSNNSSGIRLQFNLGADMFEKEFFDSWMRYIQDPVTKGFRYYDDYAESSEIYMIALPHQVANFYEAFNAVFSDPAKITGYRFTEVYPYVVGVNGNTLNYQTANEPMYLDVAMMFHDVTPLDQIRVPQTSFMKQVDDRGFPRIDGNWASQFLKDAQKTYDIAFNGHVIGTSNARNRFLLERSSQARETSVQRQNREAYAMTIRQPNITLPRAVDGLVQYPSPRTGALDLGLSIISQVQGFFGVGFFGNGFNL